MTDVDFGLTKHSYQLTKMVSQNGPLPLFPTPVGEIMPPSKDFIVLNPRLGSESLKPIILNWMPSSAFSLSSYYVVVI